MTDVSIAADRSDVLVTRHIVLDTSALVADPDGVLGAYPGDDIVIPLMAVEELDGLKKRLDPVGRAARETLRAIERLRLGAGGNLADPVPMPAGGTLRMGNGSARRLAGRLCVRDHFVVAQGGRAARAPGR